MEKEIYIDWIVNVLLYNNSSDKQTLQHRAVKTSYSADF